MNARELTPQQARQLCSEFGHVYADRYELMWLAYLAGLSRYEIAARMCVSRQTVGALVTRRMKGDPEWTTI